MCLIHDLGEGVSGDVPAPEQERRLKAGLDTGKGEAERKDLLTLTASLPPTSQDEIVSLWEEYEAALTPEAKLAKALDKLETILQHTQGMNPPGFDYRFNLEYGKAYTGSHPLIADIRRILDEETERRSRESQGQ
jgi:putative hydrolases of HD superfamily